VLQGFVTSAAAERYRRFGAILLATMPTYRRFWSVLVVAASLIGTFSCGVSDSGLGPSRDGGSGGASGTAICYTGTIERANWPAGATSTSCTKSCGPDDLGFRTCSQTDLASCQATSGCACVASPCVKCAACVFAVALTDCYLPSNVASPRTCAATVTDGGDCSPACGKSLCIQADGKTGCVCNAHGKYACASWGTTTWK
jgi:hypothetical protein